MIKGENMSLRYVRAAGITLGQMRENMQRSPLMGIGDCILVWVNEGDFWMHSPIDVASEDRERKEYERLKRKYGEQ
jgi:hypothetical protein